MAKKVKSMSDNLILDSFEPITKISKDLKKAAVGISRNEVRYMVDTYYQVQEYRKGTANQVRSMEETEEPHEMITWVLDNMTTIEGNIKKALDIYSLSNPVGSWSRSITGIGPVLAAGLLAHIDINKAPTVGHIWSFAGLDPNKKWEKGAKRPWNAELKTLCWKIGESFMKFSNHPECYYGGIFKERKALEIANNEAGLFERQAAEKQTVANQQDIDKQAADAQKNLVTKQKEADGNAYQVEVAAKAKLTAAQADLDAAKLNKQAELEKQQTFTPMYLANKKLDIQQAVAEKITAATKIIVTDSKGSGLEALPGIKAIIDEINK